MRNLPGNGRQKPRIDGVHWFLAAVMLMGLPLIGIIAAGRDPRPYLQFPPTTRYVQHADFSWAWFALAWSSARSTASRLVLLKENSSDRGSVSGGRGLTWGAGQTIVQTNWSIMVSLSSELLLEELVTAGNRGQH